MKPDTTDTNEILRRVRQQLILAQVRIMDLEDERDNLSTQLGESQGRQTAAQSLADEKSDHSQNLKVSIKECTSRLTEAAKRTVDLESSLATLSQKNAAQQKEIESLETKLAETHSHNEELNSQIVAIKRSRSWRWTAWLRSLGF